MKVELMQHVGTWTGNGIFEYMYVFMSENGIIRKSCEDMLLDVGSVFELPDEEWQFDSDRFIVQCEECNAIYDGLTQPGLSLSCPVCGKEEHIPTDAVGCYEDDW